MFKRNLYKEVNTNEIKNKISITNKNISENGIRVISNSNILDITVQYPFKYNKIMMKKHKEKDKMKYFALPSNSNLKIFTKMFGKPRKWEVDKKLNFWAIEYKGINLIITSKKEVGSTIEVELSYEELQDLENEKKIEDIVKYIIQTIAEEKAPKNEEEISLSL